MKWTKANRILFLKSTATDEVLTAIVNNVIISINGSVVGETQAITSKRFHFLIVALTMVMAIDFITLMALIGYHVVNAS